MDGGEKELGMAETMDFMDRIVDLPPFIVHKIMTYFSRKELARSSLLNKRWNELRKLFPILDLNDVDFLGEELRATDPTIHEEFYKNKYCKRMKGFLDFVYISLDRFRKLELRLHTLKLSITLLQIYESHSDVHKCIELAVEIGVKELDLKVDTNLETTYNLPQVLYLSQSITTMKLCGCSLNTSDTIRLHSLKKLTLEHVDLDEQILQKLISECFLLEKFSIISCLHIERFHVSKLLNLKVLKIWSSSIKRVVIRVRNLEHVVLVVDPTCVVDMASSPHLKYLRWYGSSYTDQQFDNFMSKFPSLESLIISDWEYLERIRVSSDGMKKLSISLCPNLKALHVDAPNLLFFKFHITQLLDFSINVPCIWDIYFSSEDDFDSRWHLGIKEFLSAADHVTLHLSFSSWENAFDVNEYRSSEPPLPVKVDELDLCFNTPPWFWASQLDVIFCMCYPRRLFVKTWDQSDSRTGNRFAQWLYVEIIYRKLDCCKSQHVKCWRHYIKDVKFEFVPSEGKTAPNIDDGYEGLPILQDGHLWFHLSWYD